MKTARVWLIAATAVLIGASIVAPMLVGLQGPILIVLIIGLSIMAVWYHKRKGRIIDAIVRQQLCMHCGYSVVGSPRSEERTGVCPECGKAFYQGDFRSPGRGYLGGKLDDCVDPPEEGGS